MTIDWKHCPRYPVHLHRPQHERRTRIGNLIAGVLIITGASLVAGYKLGTDDSGDALPLDLPKITSCPASNPDQDVIEHAWSHKGVIIHRECLIVSKPIYASPRYSTTRPTM